MITPSKVIELLKQKKSFGERHPHFVGGIGEILRSDLKSGDCIEVNYIKAGEETRKIELRIGEEDVTVLNDIGYIFK